jgi:hypothetical protein
MNIAFVIAGFFLLAFVEPGKAILVSAPLL